MLVAVKAVLVFYLIMAGVALFTLILGCLLAFGEAGMWTNIKQALLWPRLFWDVLRGWPPHSHDGPYED